MTTRTVRFKEVGFSVTKFGICPVCGKKTRRSQSFFQTLNPWNVNVEGEPKTPEEIYKELAVKADAWKALSVYHAKCEGHRHDK